ncbi:MAG: endonuclease/exonuclease/phosphatase family metal-dependent hydrolase [Acidimicrobiales bacterium]|jgi:endonuclease/exonuclease/phosphatase family metal-dependent hydrolase
MVLTEARTNSTALVDGHALWCEPPRGSRFAPDERKVLIWSRRPWRDIDRAGADGLDSTRFIAATTETPAGPIRVLGVCVPWHMAEVTYPIEVKRRPWELHVRYLKRLETLLSDLKEPTVVAGDFNQRVPRLKYGNRAAAAALERAFLPLNVVTVGRPQGCSRPGIDHIALSPHLAAERVWGWPNDVTGARLSDHDGAGCQLAYNGREAR